MRALYEAVARGNTRLPGARLLEVEVKSPNVTHAVIMRRVQEWLDGAFKPEREGHEGAAEDLAYG